MAEGSPGAPPPEHRLPGFLSAFGVRDFRLLWTGAFLSSVGTWTQDVALAWLIHTEFRNPVYLGLRSFASDAPLLALMLVGGAIADRVDRRRILLVSQVIQMMLAAALGLLYVSGRLGVGAILSIAFLTGLTQSQSAPTYQAVLTSVVPPAQIPNAVALNSLQFNLSRAIGPVIAGVLLARAGTGFCFAVNAASFLAVIVALLRMRLPAPATAPTGSLRQSLVDGFRHLGRSPLLAALMVLAAVGSFLGFPLITYLPVIADEALHAGAEGYSLLLSSFGAGAIVGAIATAHRGNRPGRGRLLLQAFIAFAVATLLAILSRWPLVSMALLAASGVSLVTAFSTLNSLVQELAPGELRGRVIAIYGLAFRGGMPVGSVVAGLLIAPLGAPLVIGGFCLALGLVAGVLLLRAGRIPSL
jgi:predicted MFS family arabinose efflux permease